MKIVRKSEISGVTRTKEIPVTEEQLRAYYDGGMLIQNAMPDVSADDREFIMTGITPKEWDTVMGEPEDEGDDDEPAF